MPKTSTPSWLAIWLPRLPTDRLTRRGQAPADAPFATTRKAKNRIELAAINAQARRAGLNIGLALADARARLPHLIVREEDEAADLEMLDEIAAWCERFTPIVVLDPPAGLFLDIAGVAHLFGGEEALRALVVERLQAQDFHARAAIAPTPGAAWALARFGSNDSGELAPLPVEALRLNENARDFLRRMGLTRIGQILEAPRTSFAARAGENALLRLDQALGRASEALTPRRPPPPIFSGRRFLEPLAHEDAILIGLDHAAGDVMAALEQRGAGASRFALDLFAVSGGAKRVSVGLSRPARDGKRLVRLFREKFAALTSPLCDEFGIEAIRLSAFELRTLDERTGDWLEQQSGEADVNALMDALSSRLGPQAALRAQIRAEHLPEHAGVLSSEDEKRTSSAPLLEKERPLRLFSPPLLVEALAAVPDGPPERFRWRRVLRRVVRAEGPERIAPPWFNEDSGPTRDYFRIEDDQGRRYWLFREGLYGEVETPRWFIHGLFA
jgi:protein ImuB